MNRHELIKHAVEDASTYMDDNIREDVHSDLAPCSPEEFWVEYAKRDPNWSDILNLLWHDYADALRSINDEENYKLDKGGQK